MERRTDGTTPRARLVVEAADGPGTVHALGDAAVVGRSEDCDVVVPDGAVSRRHARIERGPDGWTLADLGSSTGTWVEGARVEGPTPLRHGAKIRLGRVRLRFELPAAEGVAERAPVATAPVAAPAAASPGPPDPLVGASLGDLRLLEVIGVGATGRVYRARQENLGREVAVKVLSPALAAVPEKVEAFLREARAEAQLVHPCIVTVFDAGRSGEHVYFVMELMDGGALDRRLAAAPGGKLPWKQAFPMLLAAARGLAFLHERGYLHRDLKPGNLLLKSTGEVKIADLGIALPAREAAGATKAGTPKYAAPEVVRGEKPTVAADLFSLGATFHHVLTGRTVFEGQDRNELLRHAAEGHRARVLHRAADVPGWLANAIDRLTSPRAEDRFASAAELVDALQETDVRRKAREMGLTSAARPRKPRWRGPTLGLLVVAALGATAWALLSRSPDAEAQRARTATASGATEDLAALAQLLDRPVPPAADAAAARVDDVLRRAEAVAAAGRPVTAIEAVLTLADAPSWSEVGDAAAAQKERCRAWVRRQAAAHRSAVEKALLEDQDALAAAYRSGLATVADGPSADDVQAILRLPSRAAAVEEVARAAVTAPVRRRAAALAARLRRMDTTWQRLMTVLADDKVIGAWDEIRDVPQVPAGSQAFLSRAVPPTTKRITFEREGPDGRDRVSFAWSDFGVRPLALRIVAPVASRMDAAFRLDLAELFAEASCADGAAVCLEGASGRDAERVRAEVEALHALAAARAQPEGTSARIVALQGWPSEHPTTDAQLRLASGARVLALTAEELSAYFAPDGSR